MASNGELPKPRDEKRVGELLVEEGLITEQQLNHALKAQKQKNLRLLELLVELGFLTRDEVHAFLKRQSGVPSIDVNNYVIPRDLLSIVPADFARKNVLLPIDKMGHLLTVGMACPLDKAAIAELEKMTGLHVKAMLCQMDDIVKVIRRYYPDIHEYDEKKLLPKATQVVAPLPEQRPQAPLIVRPRMSDVEVIERLERLDFLIPYPGTIDHLLSAAEDPNRTLRDVAGIVGTDPATTAYFISVANCVPYGFTGKVTNANTAALLLGVPGAMALAVALREAPPIPERATFDYHDFWVRSLYCAAAAMAICRATGGDRLGDAYTAGLLHDIGRLALAVIGVEDAAAPNGVIGDIAEPSASGHPEAGYALAKHWRLPAPIDAAIRHHHRPNLIAEDDTIAKIVAMAALMSEAHARKENIEPHLSENYTRLMNQIALSTATALDIFSRIGSTLEPATIQ